LSLQAEQTLPQRWTGFQIALRLSGNDSVWKIPPGDFAIEPEDLSCMIPASPIAVPVFLLMLRKTEPEPTCGG
jgi:hypothetical protein